MHQQTQIFILSIGLFLFLPKLSYSQTNSISLELAGSGIFYSINYERSFLEREKFTLATRIGFTGFPIYEPREAVFFLPLGLEARLGPKPHQLSLGLGASIMYITERVFAVRAVPSISYRYQPIDKKMFYKISYAPFLPVLVDTNLPYLWGGITIGRDF